MKKIILILLALIAVRAYADDTATLQALITAGNTTLPAGHAAYHVTGLILSHNLNANGDTIYCTSSTGDEFSMSTAGVKLSNGIFIGPTDAINTSGVSGVLVNANSDTVTNCVIKTFPNYGIVMTGGNSPVFTGNTISDTGFIGQFVDPSATTVGGIISGNTYDRSMLSASTITQPDLIVQTTSSSYKTRGWTISNNTFKMPSNPTDITAACMELKYAPKSTVSGSTCQGGSIGVSIVGSDTVKTSGGTYTGQNLEGVEYASSNYGNLTNLSISSQSKYGLLFDGSSPASHDDTVYNASITSCATYPVLCAPTVASIFFLSDKFTTTSAQDAVYLHQATNICFCACQFVGGSVGTNAVLLDNSTGTVDMCCGSVSGFTSHVFFVYASTAITINNILMQNINLSGTPTGLGQNLSGGATLGSNIEVY